jgi:UDP-N-acetyl-D-mannosaminuronic acid transferase (WecB/TagA/CpsF family)
MSFKKKFVLKILESLLTKQPIYKKQKVFRTKTHNIYTAEQNKKALSAYDDKRFILEDGINTLAWGHYQIKIENDKFLNNLKELKTNEPTIQEF